MSGKESSRVRGEHTAGMTSGQTSLRLTAHLEGDQKLEWEVQIWVHGCVIENSDPGSKVEFLRLWEKSSSGAFTNGSVLSRWKRKDIPSDAKEQHKGKSSNGTKKRVVSMPWGVGLVGGRMPVIGEAVTRNAVEQRRRDHSEVTGGLSTRE